MITVVGVGVGGELTPRARDTIAAAECISGGTRHLDRYAVGAAERFDLTGRMKELRPWLAERADRNVVVLASGDPLFYGIGGFLARHFEGLTVLPAPSSVAEAFARAAIGWEDAVVLSAHGRPMPDVAAALDRAGKVAVLTDATNTPAAIGRLLGHRDGDAWVCERLGEDDERVRRVPIADLMGIEADPLNVVVLRASPSPRPTIPWIDDADFEKKMPKKGLITKREVRTVSLGALGVTAGDTCWDLGAGSGAVSVEMARLGAARVCAVEKNADGCAIVRENAARFATPQVEVLHARAPEGLDTLPDPDRVFIGGSGGGIDALVATCLGRLRKGGRLVVNVATVENLAECVTALKAADVSWSITQVSVARSAPILDLTRFEALNPVWVIAASPREEVAS